MHGLREVELIKYDKAKKSRPSKRGRGRSKELGGAATPEQKNKGQPRRPARQGRPPPSKFLKILSLSRSQPPVASKNSLFFTFYFL